MLLASVALAGYSFAVVRLIGSAWTECANIEAGGRFALVFGYVPLTATAIGLAVAITVHLTRRLGSMTRLVLSLAAVVLVTVVLVMWSVPVSGYDDWPGGPGDEASAQCGPGGIPTWWPSWFPN
jgi:hypothetical protein